MHQYELYLFDLDGTLTDSQEGLKEAIQYAAHAVTGELLSDTLMQEFLGPPLEHSFPHYLGLGESETEKAIEIFKTFYRQKGLLYGNRLYPGIIPVLENLKAQGKKIALATSKPYDQGKAVLDHFQLTHYFDFIGAASLDGSIREKADVIETVLQAFPLISRELMIMIGDRKYDVLGAKVHQIRCAGVSYGYAFPGELLEAGASYLIDTPEHLLKAIKGERL